MKTQKEGVGWESFWFGGHVEIWENGDLTERMEAPHPFSSLCPVGAWAIPGLYPFIING